MASPAHRTRVLLGLFVAFAVLAFFVLQEVIETVFFAITVAYVLYPIRQWLRNRGISRRIAAAIATTLAFGAGLLVLAPLGAVLYVRRHQLLAFLQTLPDSFTVAFGEFTYAVDVASATTVIEQELRNLALAIAGAAPVLGLKVFLFTLLVYALLLRPDRLRGSFFRPIPTQYHDLVEALHRRTRATLYAIYILQAATAVGTFAIGYVLFSFLGYDAAFSIGAVSGLLQFIPILGPSILIVALASIAAITGDISGALAVGVLGLLLVAFLPDAIIRPKLAPYTAGMPGSLYFIGFVGGVLSVGVIGVIAGPLVVALLAEITTLLTAEREHPHRWLDQGTTADAGASGPDEADSDG